MKERVSLNIRLFLVTMCIAVPVIAALFLLESGKDLLQKKRE